MNAETNRKPRIGILVLSAIPDDPRVRRQGDLFTQAGWDVKGFGLPGGRSSQPGWPIFTRDNLPPPVAAAEGEVPAPALPGTPNKVETAKRVWREEGAAAFAILAASKVLPRKVTTALTVLRKEGLYSTLQLTADKTLPATIRPHVSRASGFMASVQRSRTIKADPARWEELYWPLNGHFRELHELARQHHCDVWLANDWTVLPIAARLAAEQKAVLLYDTHELASDEYPEQWRWRMFHKPLVMAIEGASIHKAARVTCVSDGIADRLQVNYGLKERPLVIRNTPVYQAMPFRPTGERIEVLYHGAVSPGRGLEDCIRAVALMRSEFRFTIRGPASPEYHASLQRCIAEAKVDGRVTLAPPVAMIDLVAEANRFDVGLFALPGHSHHNVYALPNKLFEYTMAGLCVVVSDLPEMTAIVNRYDLGHTIAAVDPKSIADAVNRLDRATIDAHKKKALEAARDLNWEVEGARHVEAATQALAAAQAVAAA